MEVRQPAGGTKTVLQLQLKARRTKAATDIVYQVLWPKERKGESVSPPKGGGPRTERHAFRAAGLPALDLVRADEGGVFRQRPVV